MVFNFRNETINDQTLNHLDEKILNTIKSLINTNKESDGVGTSEISSKQPHFHKSITERTFVENDQIKAETITQSELSSMPNINVVSNEQIILVCANSNNGTFIKDLKLNSESPVGIDNEKLKKNHSFDSILSQNSVIDQKHDVSLDRSYRRFSNATCMLYVLLIVLLVGFIIIITILLTLFLNQNSKLCHL